MKSPRAYVPARREALRWGCSHEQTMYLPTVGPAPALTSPRLVRRRSSLQACAVGATITGSIVPFLAYARELIQPDGQFTPAELGVTLLLMAAAGLVAVACR